MTAYQTASFPRARFVQRIEQAFDDAGLSYAILHDQKVADSGDSDVDIAVNRESRDTADWIIRAGTFGRLLQRLDYDVPWCRYYVVECDEPGRRYRQIDLACDPWGIGCYGGSISLALESVEQAHGTRVASPAAQTVYLALKRAQKGPLRPGDAEQLRSAFRCNPSAARDCLQQSFGRTGTAVADALEHDHPELETQLRALRSYVRKARRRPTLLGRRLLFAAPRLTRRVLWPTGLIVAVVGPDGVGKTALAEGLATSSPGAFRGVTRLHFGPGLLPPPARLLGRASPNSTEPHRRLPSGRLLSYARVIYLWLDARVGWWGKLSIPRIRSNLVVLERGWADLIVDPLRYRVSGAAGLIRQLGRLIPAPDLALFLDTSPEVAHARKPELDVTEIDRQLHRWRDLAREDTRRFLALDATQPCEDVLDEALARIDDRLATRQLDVASSELVWASLGRPARHGTEYWVIARNGRARWFLRAERNTRGLLRTGIYRPARLKHLTGAVALDATRRATRGRVAAMSHLTVDPEAGLAPAIASHLGLRRVQIAGAAAPKDCRRRALLSISDDTGGLVAFAKLACDGESLRHEHRVLEELERLGAKTFVAPRVLAFFEAQGATVLVLEPLPISGRSDRALGGPEIEALSELYELRDVLGPMLGHTRGGIPAHGDFAPWNTARLTGGKLALWDWEGAHLGSPLEDYFHWQFQRIALLSVGTPVDLVTTVLDPDPMLRALVERLSLTSEEIPLLLRSYLQRRAAAPWSTSEATATRIQAMELLNGAFA